MIAIKLNRSARWAVALTVALLGMAFATTADARNTRFCPPSIAPVKGGLGDHTSLGLDDGVRGSEAAYEPGELIVVLRRGRTAADLRCVARELRAVVIEGGMGRRGLGGLPNTVILQLPAGVSVQRTANRLLQPRYRRLIVTAQPNRIGSVGRNDNATDPTATDPLFPVQWGLSLARDGQIPKTELNPFPVPFSPNELVANPFASQSESKRYSMRVRQAWRRFAQRPLGQKIGTPPVRVAIVDDSLAFHPDLDLNVAPDGNARLVEGLSTPRIELLKPAGTSQALMIRDEWGETRDLCSLTWTQRQPLDPDWVAAMVASQTDHLCVAQRKASTWRIVLDGAYRGSVQFTYDNQQSVPVDLGPLWDETGDHQGVLTNIEQTLGLLLAQNRTRAAVAVAFREPDTWDLEATRKRELRIVLYDRPGQLGFDTTGLTSAWFPISRIVRDRAGNELKDAQSTTFQVGVIFGRGGNFSVRYDLEIKNPIGLDPPVTYAIETSALSTDANATEVATRLNNAVRGAGIDSRDLRFEADSAEPNVPGYPRVFTVRAVRPVQDQTWIAAETMRVTGATGIASDPVKGTATRLAARGTLTPSADGQTATIDLNVPAIRKIVAGANATDLKVGMRASTDAVAPVDRATKWPGQSDAASEHGQFIAGIIGAQANNEGMVGVIGDQTVTGTNITMNGLVSDLSTGGALSLFDYALNTLRAQVVNYSVGGTSSNASELYDANTTSARRNDILQREDPMPPEAKQMIIGNAPDANRTLFIIAAGNDGVDVRRPVASLRALQVRGQRLAPVVQNPCRPKGMGVTVRPFDTRTRTPTPKQREKGGTLSMLRMPDGTFDRGNILCVASSDWNGHLSAFSNWGPGIVDVAAPGSNIVGTRIGSGYSTADGTSFAAPMVAGVAAMVYSAVPNAEPWLVKCAILSSATSKPLQVNPNVLPYTGLTVPVSVDLGVARQAIPYPNESPLTVSGIVQASEAISAAEHLDARVRTARRTGKNWPTCVQKRGFFGGWRNTPTLSVR